MNDSILTMGVSSSSSSWLRPNLLFGKDQCPSPSTVHTHIPLCLRWDFSLAYVTRLLVHKNYYCQVNLYPHLLFYPVNASLLMYYNQWNKGWLIRNPIAIAIPIEAHLPIANANTKTKLAFISGVHLWLWPSSHTHKPYLIYWYWTFNACI